MRFNITYLGPEHLFSLRRDYKLSIQYALQDLGHEVHLSYRSIEKDCINIISGAYFQDKKTLEAIRQSGSKYININTEVVTPNSLNFNPDKTDFLGSYLPFMQSGEAIWEVIAPNIDEYKKLNTDASYIHFGYHPRLEEIHHNPNKDLDFYLFGMLSDRRKNIINELHRRGYRGIADHSCPHFLRNDRIARAKVQLNIRQEDIYSHVPCFRIFYLANNKCAILSEQEVDPTGYLDCAKTVSSTENYVDVFEQLIQENRYKQLAEESFELFKQTPMTECVEKVLDETLVK